MNKIILTKDEYLILNFNGLYYVMHRFINDIVNKISFYSIEINPMSSKYFAETVGLKIEEILGKIYFLSCFDQFLDIVLDEDRVVIETKKTHTFLKVNKFHNVIKPMVIFKSPIINPTTNHVVGVLFQGFEYSATCNITHQINKLYNIFDDSEHKYKTSCSKKCIQLTKREKQVVFFFLAHLGSQEIADILYKIDNKKVSKSTIDSIFTDKLYVKFNVTNRVALHTKLIELGYDKFIPQEILTKGSFKLDNANIY